MGALPLPVLLQDDTRVFEQTAVLVGKARKVFALGAQGQTWYRLTRDLNSSGGTYLTTWLSTTCSNVVQIGDGLTLDATITDITVNEIISPDQNTRALFFFDSDCCDAHLAFSVNDTAK